MATYAEEEGYAMPKIVGYKTIGHIGSGLYAEVYLVEGKDGKRYAAKIMDLKTASLIEIDLSMRIDHPNIIKGVDVIVNRYSIF